MGGKNLYPILKRCRKITQRYRMTGNTYAVDFNYYLNRIMIGIKNRKRYGHRKIHDYLDINLVDPNNDKSLEELISYEDDVAHLIAVCALVKQLIDREIFGIMIFDGKSPKFKKKKIEMRKKIRQDAKNECSKIKDKTSDKFRRNHKKSVILKSNHFDDAFQAFKAMGITAIKSPEEADSQCAAISACMENVSGVISEDSDVLLFQSPKLIKNFSKRDSPVMEIELTDLLNYLKIKANRVIDKLNAIPYLSRRPHIDEFRHEYFVDYCILNGTDYNEGLNLNRKQIFTFFVWNNFNVFDMVNFLRDNNLCDVSAEFICEWSEIRKYYMKTAKVIRPQSIDLTMYPPNRAAMIDILHVKNNFALDVVDELYYGLERMYKLYTMINKPVPVCEPHVDQIIDQSAIQNRRKLSEPSVNFHQVDSKVCARPKRPMRRGNLRRFHTTQIRGRLEHKLCTNHPI